MTADSQEVEHAQNVTRILSSANQSIGGSIMSLSGAINSLTNYYENLRAQWQAKEEAYLKTIQNQQKEIEELRAKIPK